METMTKQALRFAENLTLPPVSSCKTSINPNPTTHLQESNFAPSMKEAKIILSAPVTLVSALNRSKLLSAAWHMRRCQFLSHPSWFQVVVMSANMGCIHCRQRVSQVISKMNGLLEYVVDVHNKQVIMKGTLTDPDQTGRMALLNFPTKSKKNKSSFSLCLFGSTCFSA